MPDPIFNELRLAEIYDDLDPDRSDLDVYVSIARELDARSVLDIGCGTGTFACLLAEDGLHVVGVEPAEAMLAVARRKAEAGRVRWVHGVVADLSAMQVDLATMTGNVAQVFLGDQEWAATLEVIHGVLRRGGHLVFESRRPERQAWLEWNRDASFVETEIERVGTVASWYDLIDVSLPFVTFRVTIEFRRNGVTLTSDSTLRFRTRDEITDTLEQAGFRVNDVREAPDRPGKEFVFLTARQ